MNNILYLKTRKDRRKEQPEDDFSPTLFLRAAIISALLWAFLIGGIWWGFHS